MNECPGSESRGEQRVNDREYTESPSSGCLIYGTRLVEGIAVGRIA